MHDAVRSERLFALDGEFSAGEVRDDTAGLGDDERAGGDVPRLELQLPEAVEAPGGDVAEVEGGGAGAADALRAARHAAEIFQIVVGVLAVVVGKAGREQRLVELGDLRDADGAIV